MTSPVPASGSPDRFGGSPARRDIEPGKAGRTTGCITVQQPWAWAIIHAGKDIENRTSPWSYRGRLAIHAGNRWSTRGSLVIDEITKGQQLDLTYDRALITGAIIGTVDLVDVHPDAGCCRPWGESSYTEHGGAHRTVIFHLVLEDPQPCDPIPIRGRLGLWKLPADVEAQLAPPGPVRLKWDEPAPGDLFDHLG